MSVPPTGEHVALAETVAKSARDRSLPGAARDCLDATTTDLPSLWPEIGALGRLGLHQRTDVGGSGFGMLQVIAENAHDAADMLAQLAGADSILGTGVVAIASQFALSCVALAIAGGTSEIKRNQIGERVLGLPRQPKLT